MALFRNFKSKECLTLFPYVLTLNSCHVDIVNMSDCTVENIFVRRHSKKNPEAKASGRTVKYFDFD